MAEGGGHEKIKDYDETDKSKGGNSNINEIRDLINNSIESMLEKHLNKIMQNFNEKKESEVTSNETKTKKITPTSTKYNPNNDYSFPTNPYTNQNTNNRNNTYDNIQNGQDNTNTLLLRLLHRDQTDREEKKFQAELNKIPEFSGDSKKNLDRFITSSAIAYNKIKNDDQRTLFYEELLRKTSGSALAVMERMCNAQWKEIEGALRQRFAYLKLNSDVLRSQIETLKQNKNESIADYAKRTRTLVNERIKSYDFITPDLENEIEKSSLKAFQRGISDTKIRNRVINMSGQSIDRSIQNALEVEADMSFEVERKDLFCRRCNVSGHKVAQCFKDNTDIGRLAQSIEKLAFGKRSNNYKNNERNQFTNRDSANNFNHNTNKNSNNGRNNSSNFTQNKNSNRAHINYTQNETEESENSDHEETSDNSDQEN